MTVVRTGLGEFPVLETWRKCRNVKGGWRGVRATPQARLKISTILFKGDYTRSGWQACHGARSPEETECWK